MRWRKMACVAASSGHPQTVTECRLAQGAERPRRLSGLGGGKSPVIIGAGADLDRTADRIMIGKTMNAGQICLAPDYVLVQKDRLDDFVKSARDSVARMLKSPSYLRPSSSTATPRP